MARKYPISELINLSGLRKLGIDYHNSHLLRLERDGLFPARRYLSPQRIVWLRAEIDAWIHSRPTSLTTGGQNEA